MWSVLLNYFLLPNEMSVIFSFDLCKILKSFFLHIIITADTFQSHSSNLGGEVAVKFFCFKTLLCLQNSTV